jgi:hypothetical protein
MFESLSAVHGACVNSGADSLSHIAMPSQNVARIWKLNVPPVPSCFGSVGGSFGSLSRYVLLLPEPDRLS